MLVLIIVTSMVACDGKPEPDIQWYSTFGEGTDVYGSSVQQTIDGGYIIGGRIYSHKTSPRGGACLIKTDAGGNKIWDKIFGAEEGAFGQSARQTTDGGYVLCGSIRKVFGEGGIWLIKTDAEGNELWDKILGGGRGYSVQQTADGGYILCGESDDHLRLIKTDEAGNTIWDKIFVGRHLDRGNSVHQTADGGYIVCGWTRPLVGKATIGPPNVWLIKTDAEGNKLWDKMFGNFYAEAASVQQTADGGYILCGIGENDKNISIFDTLLDKALSRARPLLIKTDAEGNKLWERTFDRGYGYSAQQSTDGGYVICGKKLLNNGWLIKTDAEGNKLWGKTFNKETEGLTAGLSVQQTVDGGYIICGTLSSEGSKQVLLLKLAPEQ